MEQYDMFPRRARLGEMHHLPFIPSAALPDASTLSWWQSRGYVEIDVDRSCFVLTSAGRERLKACCGNCACWTARNLSRPEGDDWGFCRSEDRGRENDPDVTHETELCEGHIMRAALSAPSTEKGRG